MTTAVTHEISADLRGCRRVKRFFPTGRKLDARACATGAKGEVLLVVTDSRHPRESTFWLDDDLPHVRRWAEGK
jgi:hypothetical protein